MQNSLMSKRLFDRPERMPEIELIDHGIVIAE
jgi:hypothetical protein